MPEFFPVNVLLTHFCILFITFRVNRSKKKPWYRERQKRVVPDTASTETRMKKKFDYIDLLLMVPAVIALIYGIVSI